METVAIVLSVVALAISLAVLVSSSGKTYVAPRSQSFPPATPGMERVYYLKGQWHNAEDFGPGALLMSSDPLAEIGFIEVSPDA